MAVCTAHSESEAEEGEHDEGGEEDEMGHAFDGIGLTVIEVDSGRDQGNGDHGGLNRGHRHDEGLPRIKGDALHDRHCQNDGRQ